MAFDCPVSAYVHDCLGRCGKPHHACSPTRKRLPLVARTGPICMRNVVNPQFGWEPHDRSLSPTCRYNVWPCLLVSTGQFGDSTSDRGLFHLLCSWDDRDLKLPVAVAFRDLNNFLLSGLPSGNPIRSLPSCQRKRNQQANPYVYSPTGRRPIFLQP